MSEVKSIGQVLRAKFAVMGNTAHVTVVGGAVTHLDFAERRLIELENLWSRFMATSEISKLNNSNSQPKVVHWETIKLVKYMIAGRKVTAGLFDPTLIPALIKNGYQRSLIAGDQMTLIPAGAIFNSPLESVVISDTTCEVTMPLNVTLDPGALGKGLAADIVATELIQQGVSGACVNVGGDLRCIGTGDTFGYWIVDIESPFDSQTITEQVRLTDGAVATSSIWAKNWVHDGVLTHHVIDPKTGTARKTNTDSFLQATVISRECVWAEIFATALLVGDKHKDFAMIDNHDLAAQVVCADKKIFRSSGWSGFRND